MTAQESGTDAGAAIARLTGVIERQQHEIERLRRGEASRRLLQLAQGMLIEQLRCGPAEAAEHLDRLAERAGVRPVELAADLVGSAVPDDEPDESGRRALTEAAVQVARDGSELASAVLEEALGATGAVAVALWHLCPDGALELAGYAGFDALEASRWRRLPPQMDALPQRVARSGRPLWLGDTDELRIPLFGRWPGAARAVLPLSGPKGQVGVMAVVWPSKRRSFPAPLRRELTALADVCARTVDLRLAVGDPLRPAEAAMIGSGLLARPVHDTAGTVIDFEITHVGEHLEDPSGRPPHELVGRGLIQAYPWLGASEAFGRAVEVLETGAPCRLDRVRCATQSAEGIVPSLARVRIIRFFDGVLIDWRLDNDIDRLIGLLENIQRLGHIGAWEHHLATGETTWTGETFELFGTPGSPDPLNPLDLRDHVHPGDLPALTAFQDTLRHGQEAAATFRLVRADGALRQIRGHAEPVFSEAGAVIAFRGVYQDISTQYQSQVALAATRDRLADTEEEVRQQHRVARRLQQVILPPSVRTVDVGGLEIAVRYRPAEEEHKVGGDWYDAVTLADGRVLLVIGDVSGHGIPAATGMVALRNMLRGLSTTGAGPARLLSWLNATAVQLAIGTTGTVLCGLYDPATRILRWARAGHLPPLLIRDGTAEFLPLPEGILLGAIPDAEYEERETELRGDDTLVLYTDGLIERRSVLIDDSLDRLARSACRIDGDVERVTEELLHHASTDGDDDTCLIVIRLCAPGVLHSATKNASRVSSGG
ncbi:SpoIIE family protein phosphatase [Amycolatopsis pigmentata]|uniref:SpoIIE family protein phosphatase n=1 Tax=Amycolatopsis pigmentata TaxID=450801 RepID=A0ABW5G1N8_9PSEU